MGWGIIGDEVRAVPKAPKEDEFLEFRHES